jgi:1,4-alpha-glucan branching enzyme
MKHHKPGRHHEQNSNPQLVPVRFEFTDPTALAVSVAGTFNDWQPATKQMHPLGSGHWLKETALPPGTYEYCLVVDGKWMPDPAARETVSNPYGGQNSILKVATSPAAAHRDDAVTIPLKNSTNPNPQLVRIKTFKKSATT